MGQFKEIPINTKLFKNIDEYGLTNSYAALENAFITEANGISRFPGLVPFCDIEGSGNVYLEGTVSKDIVAVSNSGKTYRIDRNGNKQSIPGAAVLGGKRVTFARLSNGLAMAAGDRIVNFDGVENSVLSDDAPIATHVAVIDNYLIAGEAGSDRWHYSEPGDYKTWKPLSVFAASGKPDVVNAVLVTPFNEILICGPESIEQYERLANGDVPFFRRWSIGDGIVEPYTMCFTDNATWGLNDQYEYIRLSGQSSQSMSEDIGKELSEKFQIGNIESLSESWASPVTIKGQKFIILQIPNAVNAYGSKGITYVFDTRQSRWLNVYGWDAENNIPSNWPGSSVLTIWGRTFVGGNGKIYEMKPTSYKNDQNIQRLYTRTAHYSSLGLVRIDSMRIAMHRGVGSYTSDAQLAMRVNRDAKGFGKWQRFSLGKTGDKSFIINPGAQGTGETWQFEFMVTDDCSVDIRKIEAEVTPLVR